jgi:hypothetical protein
MGLYSIHLSFQYVPQPSLSQIGSRYSTLAWLVVRLVAWLVIVGHTSTSKRASRSGRDKRKRKRTRKHLKPKTPDDVASSIPNLSLSVVSTRPRSRSRMSKQPSFADELAVPNDDDELQADRVTPKASASPSSFESSGEEDDDESTAADECNTSCGDNNNNNNSSNSTTTTKPSIPTLLRLSHPRMRPRIHHSQVHAIAEQFEQQQVEMEKRWIDFGENKNTLLDSDIRSWVIGTNIVKELETARLESLTVQGAPDVTAGTLLGLVSFMANETTQGTHQWQQWQQW